MANSEPPEPQRAMDTTDRLDRINSKLLSCLPMRVREYAIIDPQERVVRRRKIAAKASNNRIRNPEIICCGAGFPPYRRGDSTESGRLRPPAPAESCPFRLADAVKIGVTPMPCGPL
jgi:hypothetical protein